MEYEAVVFDLDGTLVDLAVDWAVVQRDVASLLADRGVTTDGHDLWGLWELGKETGHRVAVNECIAGHETEGARESARLPCADTVPEGPVGVCTLNAERAAREALTTHDLTGQVVGDAVVGRDSVATEKPDPEPLLATCRALGVDPATAVFVGDGERDAVTAERAGVPFRYVSEWPPSASD
ncbi:HAD family hydrolase [Salinirubellus salinus]|uniref:HAD family hydrolase n=1 Tax=Salinirubellus salinus TaxID=1364945 RepID=A0A9E7U6F1_9EURY|nr:HAD family hydrolase [Salinirubellus salinus]UWM56415.1 HAD family hydrolase [Salinirubellus salinus]